MAAISARIKKAGLRQLWDAAQKSGAASLLESLNAYQAAGWSAVQSGRIVVSNSANGNSTSFATPAPLLQLSQEQVVDLSEEYIEQHDEQRARLIAAGNEAPTDEQVFQAMLDTFLPISEMSSDYSSGVFS